MTRGYGGDKSLLHISPVPPRVSVLAPLDGDGPMVAGSPWEMATKPCACGTDIMSANHPGMIQAAVTAHNATPVHRQWRVEQAAVDKLRQTIPVKTCPCHDGEHERG